MKKRKIIVGNWKMNPETPERAREIFRAVSRQAKKNKAVDVIICPPAAFLSLFKNPSVKNFSLGAQDVFWEKSGPFTGEVSPTMIAALGASFSIIGHSERRALGETDAEVARKVLVAIRSGLKVILCVGERERDAGGAYFEFIKNQIKNSLQGARPSDLKQLIVAYEPVWAIGKSFKDAMRPSEIHEMSLFIKKILSDMFGKDMALAVPIIYGGSAEAQNTRAILSEGQVDGLLVGHKSLVPEDFIEIIKIANAV